MNKVKVLIIISGFLTKDGISNNLMNYYKYMPKNRFSFDYLCAGISEPKEEWLEVLERNDSKLFTLSGRKKHPLKYIKELRKIIKENKYQIVHAHGNSSTLFFEMFAAKKEKVRIRISHSRNTTCIHKGLDRLLRPFFYRNCNIRFACGKEAGEWLFGNKDFIIIPNGNDCSRFKYDENCSLLDINKINIITSGRVNEQKNQLYFIKVMNELVKINPNYHFVIIGEISRENVKNEIDEYIENHHLKNYVSFMGGVSNPEKYLSSADLFVLPSLYEGFPNTLIEAQMAGLPCIVSSTITSSACICPNVIQIAISDVDINSWVNQVIKFSMSRDKNKDSIRNIEILKEKGFDIEENSKKLEQKYFELYQEYYR